MLMRTILEESVKLSRDVTSDDGSCTIPVFGAQTLRLVSHCRHVGLHNTPTGFLGEEIAFKPAGAATATKALMRPVRKKMMMVKEEDEDEDEHEDE